MKKNRNGIPVNDIKFRLYLKPSDYEKAGIDAEYVEYLLEKAKEDPDDLTDDEMNDIGCFYNDGFGLPQDYHKALYWFEQAVAEDNDLARSNLADIYRKGLGGVPVNIERAFQLYSECGIPYAHYRTGEFYEKGWGVEKNLEKAKEYYRLALKEGHHLAKKKLTEWDFTV